MSRETYQTLNQDCLIGFTDKRGHAWHYKQSEQGAEPNHYPGAIPVEDVRRRLFFWKPVEGPVLTSYTNLTEDGVETIQIVDETRKTIIRPDTRQILGVFKGQPGAAKGYKIHDYDEWLIKNVETLIDGDLQIGSALLLKGGALASVTIEVPENIVTPEGVEFRPHIIAATSLDGSLSSTYKRAVGLPVCDNTLAAGLAEDGDTVKIKHSSNSLGRLSEIRSALDIVHAISDDFAAEVAALTAVKLDAPAWNRFLDVIAPNAVEDASKRAATLASNKREVLNRLWNHDVRVAPWRGTAFGAVQAVNTATHHEFNVRGSRVDRNGLRALSGETSKLDRDVAKVALSVA